MFKSVLAVMITALLPPNSNKDLPKRSAIFTPIIFPIRVEPVAETRGTRLSLVKNSPTLKSPFTKQEIPSGNLFSLATSAQIFWQAIEQIGVFSDGFQIHTSP